MARCFESRLPVWPTAKLALITFVVSMLIVLPSTYQSSITNTPQGILMQFQNLSYKHHYGSYLDSSSLNLLWGFTIAVGGIGPMVAALFLPWLSRAFGRRRVVIFGGGGCVFLAGMSLFAAYYANSFELFVFGQFLGGGFGYAFCYYFGCVYLTECAPVHQRGMIGSFVSVGNLMGTSTAYVFGLPNVLGSADCWQWYAVLTTPLAALSIVLLPLLPESPKHLYLSQGVSPYLIKTITALHGSSVDFAAVLQQYEDERLLAESQVGIVELLSTRHFRIPFGLAALVAIFFYTSGGAVLTSYSTSLYESSGVSNFAAGVLTIATVLAAFVATVSASLIVDKIGRRKLLLGGGFIVVVCLAIFVGCQIAVEYTSHKSSAIGYISIIAMLVNQTVLAFGPGPVGAFLYAELFPEKACNIATSAVVVVSDCSYVLLSFAFPPLQILTGCWTIFYLLLMPSLSCLFYFYICLPETKGLPVSEIVKIWKKSDRPKETVDMLPVSCTCQKKF